MEYNYPPEPRGRGVPKALRTRKRDQLDEFRGQILAEAVELGLSGATDFEAAETLGISVTTLNIWKGRDPAFAKALQVSKDIADSKIEASLFHKARGYTFRSEKIFNNDGIITRAETFEHVPPDTTAMIFWLKNRQRERWRDVQDHKVDGQIEHNHTHTIEADPRRLAIALLATLRKAVEAPMIEGEVSAPDK